MSSKNEDYVMCSSCGKIYPNKPDAKGWLQPVISVNYEVRGFNRALICPNCTESKLAEKEKREKEDMNG